MNQPGNFPISRREFLVRTALGTGALATGLAASNPGAKSQGPDIVVFSKIYQSLKLDYSASAELTAQAGMQGVDAAVRPGGEVLPERVKDDLPRYVEALQKHGLKMPMITTAITGPEEPHTEAVLTTAKKLGIRYYRLGAINPSQDLPKPELIRRVRERFARLAVMNREIGITAMLQNHSPSGRSTYLGGDLDDMRQVLDGFDPAEIGAAFDIGHALAVHGKAWREKFAHVQKHLRVAYAKDWKPGAGWVAMGEGDILGTGYFDDLKRMRYSAPVSLHIEHDWDDKGASKTREQLTKVLRADTAVLRKWLA